MNNRLRMLNGVVLLVFALTCSSAYAAKHWAVTTSLGSIQLVSYDSAGPDKMQSYTLADMPGSSLSGVATWKDYIFVADSGTATASVRVGKIITGQGAPRIDWLGNPLLLQSGSETMRRPGSVVVDSTGGIYVVGSRYYDSQSKAHSNYAYITPGNGTWTQDSVKIINLDKTVFSDVATYGNGVKAIFAHRYIDNDPKHWADQTWVTGATRNEPGASSLPDDTGYFPRAIAAGTNGYSYVANYSTEVVDGDGPAKVGSISIINNSTQEAVAVNAYKLISGSKTLRPTDISFFKDNGVNYLGVVGTVVGGNNEAWKIELNQNGMPVMNNVVAVTIGNSTDHYCAVSDDNDIFWVTNPQSNQAVAIDAGSWTASAEDMGDSTGYIDSYIPYVPEPSSLMILATAGLGLLAFRRRK